MMTMAINVFRYNAYGLRFSMNHMEYEMQRTAVTLVLKPTYGWILKLPEDDQMKRHNQIVMTFLFDESRCMGY